VRRHRERRSDGVDRASVDHPHIDAARRRRTGAVAASLNRRLTQIDMRGRLYLVPNLLGLVPPERVLPTKTIAIARGLEHFIVENAKPARAFLKSLDPPRPIGEIAIVELGAKRPVPRLAELLAPALAGHDVGLLSDAGCPSV